MDLFGFLFIPLLAFAAITLQGRWLWLVPVIIFILIPILDRIVGDDLRNFQEPDAKRVKLGQTLCWVYAFLQLVLIGFGASQIHLFHRAGFEFILISLNVGLVTGGIGITVAHELVHRSEKFLRTMGMLLLSMVCYGHFTVEHVHGHHTWVATEKDPASARFNESVYRFFPRTLFGSWLSAWKIEKKWLQQRHRHWLMNRVLFSSFVSLFFAAGFYWVWGVPGMLYFILQSWVAIILLEVINYVEHYGLSRELLANGKFQGVEEWHSWDSRRRLSNGLLINLQHHSDHHQYPGRDFPRLRFHSGAPLLPGGYPEMVLLALVPPLWFRIMNPRCEAAWVRKSS